MARPLRILKITGAYPPAFVHGGTATAAHSLVKSLIKLGHNVSVLTTDINGRSRLAVPKGWTTWDGVRVRYCRWIRGPLPYFSWELFQFLRHNVSLYDIVLLDSGWTSYGVLSGFECNRAGVPYLIYAHGCHSPMHLRKSLFKKKLWWWAFDRSLYNRAAATVALSKAEISYLCSMGVVTRIEHIANGVEMDALENAETREAIDLQFPQIRGKRIVLFLGRLEPIKGLDLLIPAFVKVHQKFPKAILVIAGPDDRGYIKVVRHLIQQCNLMKDVLLTGLVTGAKKVGLLRSAEAFVLPSYGEGFSMTALEAMACGKPVILTQACNFPEVEEFHAGLLVESNSCSIAGGICQILQDRSGGSQMGHNGKKLVIERFSWQDIARKTDDLCRNILSIK